MFVQQISAFTLSTWKGIMFLFILLLLHQIRYASNHLVWQMVDTVFGKLCLHMSTSLSCLYIKWYEGSTWGHWFTGNFMGRMLAYNWRLTEQEKKVEHTGLTCFWSVSLWELHLLFFVPNLSPRLYKVRGSYLTDSLLVFDIQIYVGYVISRSTTILGINLNTIWMCTENYPITILKEIILSNT